MSKTKNPRKTSARKRFETAYGSKTVSVILDLVKYNEAVGISRMSLAAYKANLTRGTYAPFARLGARGRVVGTAV